MNDHLCNACWTACKCPCYSHLSLMEISKHLKIFCFI
ncbi:hypothetical protein SLEP1_g53587 [Rubroshorea leprosula]|uniref:Uncharacterized protein n=1 Tax=Rubroshorea leprosula TaxID=152421 RepID=A0AAV5M9U2_9ROSI|nr:hypothetical protein SLEP1_g53587 [Rubroshorea leprosula]